MYLPAVGLALVAAWLLDLAWRRAGTWKVGTALIALTLIAIETTTARAQLNQWRNTETLYNHMINYTPDVSILHANLGEDHWQKGRVEAAHQSFARALKLDPNNPNAHNNLGVLFWATQRPQEAFKHLSLAVAADPNLSQPHRNLGIALNGIGRFAEAANEFELSLVINPGDPQTQCGYALSLSETGRIAKAREHYAESVRLQPGCALPPGALQ
jgi:tetratricopeptide (TPR) repeat protein